MVEGHTVNMLVGCSSHSPGAFKYEKIMPRKKLDKTSTNDLRNFTQVPEDSFWYIWHLYGNKKEYLKIVDRDDKAVKYYIFSKYLDNQFEM